MQKLSCVDVARFSHQTYLGEFGLREHLLSTKRHWFSQGRRRVDPGALRHRRRLRHRSRGHRLGRGPGSKYLPGHLRLLSVHSLQSLSKGSLEPFASLSRVFNRFRTVGSFFSDVLIRNGSFLLLRFLRALSNGPRFPSGSIPFFRFSSPF